MRAHAREREREKEEKKRKRERRRKRQAVRIARKKAERERAGIKARKQTRERSIMGWLRLVGSLKLQVTFAKEPCDRDDILQQRPVILRSLLIKSARG